MAKKIFNLLHTIQPALNKAIKHQKIKEKIDQCLIGHSKLWDVANYDKGILTLMTNSAAFATHLKFSSLSLKTQLRKKNFLPELIAIKIKTIPNMHLSVNSLIANPERPKKHIQCSEKTEATEDLDLLLKKISIHLKKKAAAPAQ